MTRLPFIPAQTIKTTLATRPDLAQCIVGGIHIVSSVGRARLWKVNLADFSNAGEIALTNEGGKDDSVSAQILANGDLLVSISEATPGGDGATAGISLQRIPGVFPPAPAASGGTVDTTARAGVAALLARINRHILA